MSRLTACFFCTTQPAEPSCASLGEIPFVLFFFSRRERNVPMGQSPLYGPLSGSADCAKQKLDLAYPRNSHGTAMVAARGVAAASARLTAILFGPSPCAWSFLVGSRTRFGCRQIRAIS